MATAFTSLLLGIEDLGWDWGIWYLWMFVSFLSFSGATALGAAACTEERANGGQAEANCLVCPAGAYALRGTKLKQLSWFAMIFAAAFLMTSMVLVIVWILDSDSFEEMIKRLSHLLVIITVITVLSCLFFSGATALCIASCQEEKQGDGPAAAQASIRPEVPADADAEKGEQGGVGTLTTTAGPEVELATPGGIIQQPRIIYQDEEAPTADDSKPPTADEGNGVTSAEVPANVAAEKGEQGEEATLTTATPEDEVATPVQQPQSQDEQAPTADSKPPTVDEGSGDTKPSTMG